VSNNTVRDYLIAIFLAVALGVELALSIPNTP